MKRREEVIGNRERRIVITRERERESEREINQ